MKKIVFLTGTRADYGKIKSLIKKVDESKLFECHVFVTGMHMLSKYGSTHEEVSIDNHQNLHKFINQSQSTPMDQILANTINGFSNFVAELNPNMIVVHGDRLEALAGAIVGTFNNILVGHIEGGEVSGTLDEAIRHSITKLAHIHFVSNNESKKRVCQLGENPNSIFIIGSPDLDIMYSNQLPDIKEVYRKYELNFSSYGILMYHPVTTELEFLTQNSKSVVDSVLASKKNYIVIYPNNDTGSDIILKEYKRLQDNPRFRIFPSIRFEYFLTLLKNSSFIIGNSSAGIREAPAYGIRTINIGSRQMNRVLYKQIPSIINIECLSNNISKSIGEIDKIQFPSSNHFGDGKSTELFISCLETNNIFDFNKQKIFIDLQDN